MVEPYILLSGRHGHCKFMYAHEYRPNKDMQSVVISDQFGKTANR